MCCVCVAVSVQVYPTFAFIVTTPELEDLSASLVFSSNMLALFFLLYRNVAGGVEAWGAKGPAEVIWSRKEDCESLKR